MLPTQDKKIRELINGEVEIGILTKKPSYLITDEIMEHLELNGYHKDGDITQ